MSDADPQSNLSVLLDSARGADDPTGEDRERVRTQLFARIASGAAAGAVIATTSSTASATAATSLTAIVAKTVGVLALVTAVGATARYATAPRAEPRAISQPRAITQPRASSPGTERAQPTRAAQPEVIPEPARAITAPVAAPVSAPRAQLEPARPARPRPGIEARPTLAEQALATRPAIARPASTLGDELALITAARAALARGMADEALAQLDRYEQRFDRGSLRPESLAARVDALCALGRRERAASVAEMFAREFPRSPLLSRVRAACQ